MAATVKIYEWNSAVSNEATDKSSGSVYFKNANNAVADLNDPIVKPTGATVYSLEKYLRARITVAPAGSITSPRIYSDGGNGLGTGVTLNVGIAGAWATPLGGSTTASLIATANFFTKTSGSPLAIDVSNPGPYTGTGDIADFIVLQAGVANTVSAGLTAAEVLTLAFNES